MNQNCLLVCAIVVACFIMMAQCQEATVCCDWPLSTTGKFNTNITQAQFSCNTPFTLTCANTNPSETIEVGIVGYNDRPSVHSILQSGVENVQETLVCGAPNNKNWHVQSISYVEFTKLGCSYKDRRGNYVYV